MSGKRQHNEKYWLDGLTLGFLFFVFFILLIKLIHNTPYYEYVSIFTYIPIQITTFISGLSMFNCDIAECGNVFSSLIFSFVLFEFLILGAVFGSLYGKMKNKD